MTDIQDNVPTCIRAHSTSLQKRKEHQPVGDVELRRSRAFSAARITAHGFDYLAADARHKGLIPNSDSMMEAAGRTELWRLEPHCRQDQVRRRAHFGSRPAKRTQGDRFVLVRSEIEFMIHSVR